MMSYENMIQASTPKGWLQSVTHKKENTKQLNANLILQCLWSLLKMLGLHLCIWKNNNGTKTEEKHNSLLLLWLLLFYIHNQYKYPNNYQTINYSFKDYLLFVLLLLLLLSLLSLILILILLLLLLLFLLLLSFLLSSILFANVCVVLNPSIFFSVLCHRLKINNHIPCI